MSTFKKRFILGLVLFLVSFSLLQAAVPEAPGSYVGVSKLDDTNTSVRVSFKNNSDNEEGFRVLVYDYAKSTLVKTITIDATNSDYGYANITGLTCDKTYQVEVVAYNSEGESPKSDRASFNIKSTFGATCVKRVNQPGPYIGVSPLNGSSSAVRLSFKDNADNEEGFRVFDGKGINVTVPANDESKSAYVYVNVTGLNNAEVYSVQAVAFGEGVESEPTPVRSFSIKGTLGIVAEDNATQEGKFSNINYYAKDKIFSYHYETPELATQGYDVFDGEQLLRHVGAYDQKQRGFTLFSLDENLSCHRLRVEAILEDGSRDVGVLEPFGSDCSEDATGKFSNINYYAKDKLFSYHYETPELATQGYDVFDGEQLLRHVGAYDQKQRGFTLFSLDENLSCHRLRVEAILEDGSRDVGVLEPFGSDCSDNNTTVDTTPPVITLNGEANITLAQNATYTELGATAQDAVDGNVTVTISGMVDTSTTGEYTLTYTATDSSGNRASVSRTVRVEQRFLPPAMTLPEELESTLAQGIVPYDRMTLEVGATSTVKLTALNQTLAEEQNRSIELKGVENNGTFYLYNVPLLKGTNTIRLQSTNGAGETTQKTIAINADANQSVPLAMRATVYEGVQSLDTTVEVGTDLNVTEYLFDVEGDGKIDTIQADANFTLHLTDEGRYRPRVTVRTAEGLLYSSGDYALSLDVKATADQKDPVGARPLDMAKAFQTAVLAEDRASVERLTGSNPNIIHLLYGNKHALPLLKEIYSSIQSWEEKTWSMGGRRSISYTFEVNGTVYGGGMELKLIDAQIKTGREWIIDFIY